ncbi:MAG: hypothetical protein IH609_05580 [Dehalococcoidia bacterium]|nr:hypothetical protein [Dehalococcoidia bacterium]
MADDESEFSETVKRLLRVPRHELRAEEREWEEEQREKRTAPTPEK